MSGSIPAIPGVTIDKPENEKIHEVCCGEPHDPTNGQVPGTGKTLPDSRQDNGGVEEPDECAIENAAEHRPRRQQAARVFEINERHHEPYSRVKRPRIIVQMDNSVPELTRCGKALPKVVCRRSKSNDELEQPALCRRYMNRMGKVQDRRIDERCDRSSEKTDHDSVLMHVSYRV